MVNKKQGIIYIICAGFFFSLMTFFVRISGDLPTMQKAFFRNAVAAVVSLIMLAASEDKFKINKSTRLSVLFRCICGMVGLICNFYAIDRLNIADANILNKLSPFFAIIMSAILLKEKANRVEWISIVIAFLGAMFVIKPSFDIQSVYGFIGMIGGLGAGVAYAFVRKATMGGERGTVIVMCFSVFSCAVTLPFLIINYQPMSAVQLITLLAAGASATGGQLCITKAYTKAPAKEISVFDYSQVLFAALLGFIFLGQVPDIYSIIGYFIIIGIAVFKWRYNMSDHSN